jgi:diphthamide synthase (EF-2-diphthine--ammonia ligase)
MAKSAVSAEQFETIITTVLSKTLPEIMLKVLEKFENQLDRLIDRFEAKIAKVSGEMHTLYTGMGAQEANIALLQAADAQSPVATSATTDIAGIVEITSRALISMEKRRRRRKRLDRDREMSS